MIRKDDERLTVNNLGRDVCKKITIRIQEEALNGGKDTEICVRFKIWHFINKGEKKKTRHVFGILCSQGALCFPCFLI